MYIYTYVYSAFTISIITYFHVDWPAEFVEKAFLCNNSGNYLGSFSPHLIADHPVKMDPDSRIYSATL